MKKRLIILGVIVLAASGLMGYNLYKKNHIDPSVVRLSGNIEMVTVDISFKIPGPVLERRVDEGQEVKKDQVVAVLDSSDIQRELAQRQAEVNAAQAVLDELLAGSRPEEIAQAEADQAKAKSALDDLLAGARPQEIAASEAAVARAKADETNTKNMYDRALEMQKASFATAKEVDDTKAAYDAAHARLLEAQENLKLVQAGSRKDQIEQARSALKRAEQTYALVKAGPRKETIEQAKARLEMSKAAYELTKTKLGYAQVLSPMDGMVIAKNIEPGEYVSPGTPVITVADVKHVYLRAFVSESDLHRVKLGQKVRVTVDGTGRVFEGTVSFISPDAEFTPKNVQTEKERVKLVYRIKIDLPNPDMELKAGMPADAEIITDQS